MMRTSLALLCVHAAASTAAGGCDAGSEVCPAEAQQDHVLLQHQRKVTTAKGAWGGQEADCLCVFDVDRTLTGQQGSAGQCSGNHEVQGVYDNGYGGGTLTLSALGAARISSTFCGQCYLGIISAGNAGGDNSAERAYLANNVLVSGPHDSLAQRNAQAKAWSYANRIRSPFVLSQPDRTKHDGMKKIVRWYQHQGIRIPAHKVHFFGDRTENIMPFQAAGYNAREISCGSRDYSIQNGMVGLCGARTEEIVATGGVQTCEMQSAAMAQAEEAQVQQAEAEPEPCLCVFDVDRTLTGKQHAQQGECPRNQEVSHIYDNAYGGGSLHLSALAAEGLQNTFCGQCYLGICSAGDAGGDHSAERAYLVDHVLVSGPQQALAHQNPQAKEWCYGNHVTSPFVLGKPDRTKQEAVIEIVNWYKQQGVDIANHNVHFFGDRTENIPPFVAAGFNAKEISCASRDYSIYNGGVGRCGATPEEIVRSTGIVPCGSQGSPQLGVPPHLGGGSGHLDDSPGHNGYGKPLQKCQGDCDQDSDCASGLKCYQRDGFNSVPGCSGKGSWDFDYCIEV